ncbi:MAG: MerR family DNA-binding transcriptional regulator [Acidimicrobiales bacterium]
MTEAEIMRSVETLPPMRKVAEILGVHEQTLRAWDRSGVLVPVRMPSGQRRHRLSDIEALGFAKDHDTNRSFNRMSTGFAYEKVLEAVVRRAVKAQVGWVITIPSFTSAIGRWKYQAAEGLSVHQAAAKVIGRRALGRRERFDPSTRNRIGELRVGLINAAQVAKAQSVPTQGTRSLASGIAKRLTRALADERLVVANGYPPWRLTWRKGSPRGALVECQRYRSSRAVAAGATTMPVGDLTDRLRTDEVTR